MTETAGTAGAAGTTGNGAPDAGATAADAGRGVADASSSAAAPETGKAETAKPETGKTETGKAEKAVVPDWAKDIAEPYRGKDERETIAKLNAVAKAQREAISKYGLPVTDAKEFAFEPSERTAAFFQTDLDVSLRDNALGVLAKAGIGKLQAGPVLNGLVEMLLDAEIADMPVDPAKERAALLPEDAKLFSKQEQEALIDKRVAKNQALVKMMQADGLDGDAVNAIVGLTDTAAGNRFLEFIAGRMGAVNPLTGGSMAAPMDRAALQKLIAETPANDLEGQKRIQEGYRRLGLK
jgi:hypothetical protein